MYGTGTPSLRLRGRVSVASLAFALAAAGCGAVGSFKVPSIPTFKAPSGDAATFVIDGGTISVVQSGSATVHVGGVPQIDHAGPLGCRGRFFTADYTHDIQILFHYSAHDAYMLFGNDLYHFIRAPRRAGGRLTWDQRFGDRHMVVSVACPLPRGTRALGPRGE